MRSDHQETYPEKVCAGKKGVNSNDTDSNECTAQSAPLKFVSWNINGISEKMSIPDVAEYLDVFDIIMLTETWLKKDNCSQVSLSGYQSFHTVRESLHRRARRASGGISVFVKEHLPARIVENVCDHFVVLELGSGGKRKHYIIVCYVPPKGTSFQCSNCPGDYFNDLSRLLQKYRKLGNVLVTGDMNARTGNLQDFDQHCGENCCHASMCDCVSITNRNVSSRKSKDSVVNDYGKELLTLCKSSNLLMANGRLNNDTDGNFTRVGSTGNSVVDYLLVHIDELNCVSNFTVETKCVESDHRPLSFCVENCHSLQKTVSQNEVLIDKRDAFKWDSEKARLLNECLFDEDSTTMYDDFLNGMLMNEDVNEIAGKFQNFVLGAVQRVLVKRKVRCSKKQFPVNPWYDEECKDIKRRLHSIDTNTDSGLDEFVSLQKSYRQLLQKKKREFQKCKIKEICSSSSEQMWSTLKSCVSNDKSVPVNPLEFCQQFQNKAEKYQSVHADKSFEEQVKSFMQKYDSGNPVTEIDPVARDIMDRHVTEDEMLNALKHLKSGKSSGLDGIPAEVLKSQSESLTTPLCMLFNYVLDKGKFPQEWCNGLTVPVPKGGDKSKAENYRRVTILPLLGKLFETIVNIRLVYLKDVLQKHDPFNGGFKKGSMTSDNLFVLNGCVEKSRALKQTLYVCFVDFKRAFDSVNRDLMFYKLLKNGTDGKFVHLLRDMYAKTQMKICIDGMLTGMISDETGVNQGGPNSPDMFVDFLSDLRCYLDEKSGVVLNDEILLHLLWADDLIIVSNSPNDLQNSINGLAKYCSQWQLILNVVKTKVVVFGKKQPGLSFTYNDVDIEISENYKYLGCLFQSEGNIFKEHLNSVITKASRATFNVQKYCKPLGSPPPSLVLKLFNSLVVPVLEYGSEIWSAGTNTDCIDVFQVKFIKRMLKLRQQTATLAVLGEVGELPLSIKLELRVLKYWMRLLKLPDGHIAKQMYDTLCSLDNIGFRSWVTYLKGLLVKYGLENLLDGRILPPNMYKLTKAKIVAAYSTQFCSLISDENRYPKLRTYKLFKSSFEMENYLWLQIPRYRISLCRLRTSSHHLEIERGRYTIPKTPAESRICKQCNLNEVEDEIHFVLNCSQHDVLRVDLNNIARAEITNFETLCDKEKFCALMSTDNSLVTFTLAKFCHHAFKNRT